MSAVATIEESAGTLVGRALRGDGEAFGAIYDRHHEDVQRLLLGLRLGLSRQVGRPIQVNGDLEGLVTLDLKQVPWRRALEAVASTVGDDLETVEVAGALVIRRRPDTSLHAVDAPLAPWLQALASLAGVNLVLPTAARPPVSLDLARVDPLAAIEATARQVGWTVERGPNVLRLVAPGETTAPTPAAPLPLAGRDLLLQATLVSGERRLAIIDGRVHAVGDVLLDRRSEEELEGSAVLQIEDTWVQVRLGDGAPRRLELPR